MGDDAISEETAGTPVAAEPDRILVTGAGRGLGLELVATALARGHRVAATVRDRAAATHLDDLAGENPGRLAIVTVDLAAMAGVAAAVDEAVAALGGLDVVVNNAGVNAMSFPDGRTTLSITTFEPAPMLGILAINAVAPFVVTRAALPALRRSPRPRVVNVSSWLGSITGAGRGNYAYSASKAALNMATRLLANELRDDGVVVAAVNPGWMRTSMGGARAQLDPQEVAGGLMDLISDLGPRHSGCFLQWDGSEHPW